MGEIQAVKDHKKEIEFWLNALSQPNLEQTTVMLLNQCLNRELRQYLCPNFMMVDTIHPSQEAIEKVYEAYKNAYMKHWNNL